MTLARDLSDRLGSSAVLEFGAGHQSRVFDVTGPGSERCVAKVLDAAMVRADVVVERVEAVAELARLDPQVCGPILVDGELVMAFESGGRAYLVTRYEYAAGTALDPTSADDARLMGAGLAQLHASLRGVRRRALPIVAALGATDVVDDGSFQLLHGDFNHDNLRRAGGVLRVFDFDDCGYGPVAFDVANALYMVLFASMTTDLRVGYRSFEEAFLAGYGPLDGLGVDPRAVGHFIDVRVRALRVWLDDLGSAPIGIRTAGPAWHEVLRNFVRRYETGER